MRIHKKEKEKKIEITIEKAKYVSDYQNEIEQYRKKDGEQAITIQGLSEINKKLQKEVSQLKEEKQKLEIARLEEKGVKIYSQGNPFLSFKKSIIEDHFNAPVTEKDEKKDHEEQDKDWEQVSQSAYK